jgi:CheY-like chemotaxis protein
VQQVLYNLVSNAVGALGGALGWIGIRTGATHCDAAYLTRCDVADGAAPGPHVFLEVSDTGVGMDEPTRKRIFEPFFTSKSDGRGLGLAAVHGLVRQHRGAIRVTSEPGVGSSFRVLLPAMREAPETAADADAPPERAPSTGVPRPPVLVVDDEAPVRSVLERQLAQAGYPVLGAGNASHALELVREDPAIGCVLLDLTIPGLPASEALRQIRALRPRLPVVLMSGYAREDVGQAVREHAPDAFLAKPFRRRELLGTLETVLASV